MEFNRPVRMGVDYYPEHWDSALWEQDARLMADSGVHIVRVGEFAWSRMEPADGQSDWKWLDQALDILHCHGLEIIIGTPTMTPPRWLTEKCPDILPILPNGQRYHEGVRGHRCYNSPSMRTYSARIVQKLSERYAKHPGVVGWQTDNEFSFTDCQCSACADAFREWVQARYSTLEQVNQRWGTVCGAVNTVIGNRSRRPMGIHVSESFIFAGLFPFSVRFHRRLSADSGRHHSPQLSRPCDYA